MAVLRDPYVLAWQREKRERRAVLESRAESLRRVLDALLPESYQAKIKAGEMAVVIEGLELLRDDV